MTTQSRSALLALVLGTVLLASQHALFQEGYTNSPSSNFSELFLSREVDHPPQTATLKAVKQLSALFPMLKNLDYSLDFPVYYINMDGDDLRKRVMEELYGPLWDLRRVPAIRGNNDSQLMSLMGEEHTRAVKEALAALPTGDTSIQDPIAELGISLSHLSAIRRAHLDGNEVAMIAEDDIAPWLMPYWTMSVRDLLGTLSNESWSLIQLCSCNMPGLEWKSGPLIKAKFTYCAAAYLISRRGMDYLLEKYYTTEGFLHLPQLGRLASDMQLLPSVPDTYIASPPYFVANLAFPSSHAPGGVEWQWNAFKSQWKDSTDHLMQAYLEELKTSRNL